MTAATVSDLVGDPGRCPVCRAALDGRRVYCSGACRAAASRARRDPIGALRELLELRAARRCDECGTPLGRRRSDARYCSDACRLDAARWSAQSPTNEPLEARSEVGAGS